MVAHHFYKVNNVVSLLLVVGIVGAGVLASVFTTAPERKPPAAPPPA
jgi:hypothetical protein